MDLRLWLRLIVTCCLLLPLTVSRRLRKYEPRQGLLAEVLSEMVPYTDDRATFKCVTLPSATIEWLFDGDPISTTDQRFTIERNKLIVHLQKIVPTSLGLGVGYGDLTSRWSQSLFKSPLFQCKATFNDETIISEPAKLIVTFLDDFESQPDRVINTVQGNTAVIPCKPPNSMPIAITEFYTNNYTLISKTEGRYVLINSGNLQILDSQPSDSGIYRCVAYNAFLQERRNSSWTVRLNVQPYPSIPHPMDPYPIYSLSAKSPVQFVVKPTNETKAVMGSNVTLECVAEGIKPPNIIWYRRRNGKEESLDRKKSLQIAGNLILISVGEADSGSYICRATVDSATIETIAVVDVQMTPRFVKTLNFSMTLVEGSDFTLECQAKGNPRPEINWFFNGKSLNPFNRQANFPHPVSQLPGITFNDNFTKLSVKIARTSVHSGIYQCFASNRLLNNDFKFISSLTYVKILLPGQTPPSTLSDPDSFGKFSDPFNAGSDILDDGSPLVTKRPNEGRSRRPNPMIPPSRPKVTRFSEDSVVVHWDVPNKPSLPIQFFKLQYKEAAKKSTWNTSSEDIPPHIKSQQVSGLKTDTKYRFRIIAVYSNNDNRESPPSEKFHLMRSDMFKKPKSPPTIISVSPQNISAIEVTWNVYQDNTTNIEGFFIHYRQASFAGAYSIITVAGSNKQSYIVTNLQPGTAYEFKLQCFNSAGLSDYSAILTASTFEDQQVPTTTEISNEIPNVNDKNVGSGLIGNMDTLSVIVGGIGIFALSVFIVCCLIQCANRYQQKPSRVKDCSLSKRVNGEIANGSLLHQTNQSSDGYKSETDTLSSHPDKTSVNNVTASVSIDHFPVYHEELKGRKNNYQTRTYTIDTYCDDSCGTRTGSWSRKSRSSSKKCYETETGLKLIATASSHNSLHRKYLYENDNHILMNTLDRRPSTFKSEEHLKCSLNARVHSKSNSFTRLNGTLERQKKRQTLESQLSSSPTKPPPPVPERQSILSSGHPRSLSSTRLNGSLEKRKKSRHEYVNSPTTHGTNKTGNKSTESKMNSYNGTISHINSKPPLLIMQSTC